MNDGSPNPAADGVGGPFMKIKAANGKPCLGSMNASTNCFDTLSYLTNDGASDLNSRSYNNASWGPSNFNHESGSYLYPSDLLPEEFGHCQYAPGDDARMIATLTSTATVALERLGDAWSPEEVLARVARARPAHHALIDTGALVTATRTPRSPRGCSTSASTASTASSTSTRATAR